MIRQEGENAKIYCQTLISITNRSSSPSQLLITYIFPCKGFGLPCARRADSYHSISPGLRTNECELPLLSSMYSGQGSSTSCAMFRIAEITCVWNLSRCE